MYILLVLSLIVGGGLMANKCTFNSQLAHSNILETTNG
jgi:uncharacterized membrane protein YdcZ (DUF606 family)